MIFVYELISANSFEMKVNLISFFFQKDTIRKEREERKKERLRDEQNGDEKHRRRRDEDGWY